MRSHSVAWGGKQYWSLLYLLSVDQVLQCDVQSECDSFGLAVEVRVFHELFSVASRRLWSIERLR